MRLLDPNVPFAPQRLPFFYGWVVVGAATLGLLASIPGQTMGVSVFTDHLIAATGVSRLTLSTAYLVGTVASGLLLPRGGILLDRLGSRGTAVLAAAGLGVTLVFLSQVDAVAHGLGSRMGIPTAMAVASLVLGFVALRFTGQGMLTLASRTMLGKWFDRRRGTVAGISGVFASIGFSGSPLLLSLWIDAAGWRGAWQGMALLVGFGVAALAWLLFRDNPEECGLEMDGGPGPRAAADDGPRADPPRDLDRAAALQTSAFWAVTLALGLHGMMITGVTFHIVDLGAGAGLNEKQVVALFLPMAVVSTSMQVFVGVTADRVRIKWLVVVMLLFEMLGLTCAAHLGKDATRWLAVAGLGAVGGFFGPLSTVALPRLFGRTHLGAIGGAQMMAMVIASALGPTLLALARTHAGSYTPALYGGAALAAPVLVLALRSTNPRR
ncbi:MAG: MFS transporter [Myxococcota bacterium]